MVEIQGGQKLFCQFDYHQDKVLNDDGSISLSNQFVVTPYIVRQVIEYGLQNGWTPLGKGSELKLWHLDDKIDLRLDKNKENVLNKLGT